MSNELATASPAQDQSYRASILIPNHNHKHTMIPLLDQLETHHLNCVIVDDGSEPGTMRLLREQAESRSWVRLVRRPEQGGKGAAVMTGLRFLHEHGFTHALQLDADGQHAADDVPLFIRESMASPEALVLGTPTFGPDVPKMRLAGRQISRFLIWVETLSFDIGDPLFGFRVYPLKPTMEVINRDRLGERMDFDPEIAIRLKWSGLPVKNIPTRVSYPEDGTSNFRMFTDNVLMVRLHFRMFGEILRRLVLPTAGRRK